VRLLRFTKCRNLHRRHASIPIFLNNLLKQTLNRFHYGLLHGCRELLLRHLEHLLPSFCTDLGLCRVVPLIYSHSSLPAAVVLQFFHPFLNLLSQRHCHRRWWARPWPAAGLSWSWLALASLDTGGSFWQLLTEATPAAPCYQNLATQTQYKGIRVAFWYFTASVFMDSIPQKC